jgi:hypothetical protein
VHKGRRWIATIAAAVLLVGCGSSGHTSVAPSTTAPSTLAPTTVAARTATVPTVPATVGSTVAPASSPGDTIKVTKCYSNGPELLIKASSSDKSARLFAYRQDGTLIGEVQNGGGGRYGGTVMPHQSDDPGEVTIKSSSGGAITVKTTPFQST